MDKHTLTEFCTAVGSSIGKVEGSGYAVIFCPLAPHAHEGGTDNKASMRIRIGPEKSFGRCFSCGFGGDLEDLCIRLYGYKIEVPDLRAAMQLAETDGDEKTLYLENAVEPEERRAKDAAIEFPDWWLDSFPKALHAIEARAYTDTRAIPHAVVEMLDLRYDPNQRRVCFPTRDWSGALRGLHGRAIDADAKLKYFAYSWQEMQNPEVMTGEHRIDIENPVVIAESVFDMARIFQAYRNVLTPRFATMSWGSIARLRDCPRVITFLDADRAGIEGRSRITKALHGRTIVDHIIPYGPRYPIITAQGAKDAGEMSPQMIAFKLKELKVELDELLM